MKNLVTIFLMVFSNLLFGQELDIETKIKSVQCDETTDAYRLNTRLTKDSLVDRFRVIHFSTTATCCVDFEIKSTVLGNVVKMKLEEHGMECDCICAYDFVVQFNKELNSETVFYVNDRELKWNLSKLRPYKRKYYVFENDTTGLVDENGLRQGFMVLKGKSGLKKMYWKDGKFVKLEILDKKGNVQITETNEDKIFDY